MTLRIHSLYIYPIKSCQGIGLERAELVDTGLRWDRHWMLVDDEGQFLSQRRVPAMARIATELTDDALIARSDGRQIEIPLHSPDVDRMPVQIWNDLLPGSIVSEAIDRWFSEVLETCCHLVYLPESVPRQVDRDYAAEGRTVGFADSFPLLVVSLENLLPLNARLEQPVGIDRFRPNIVIEGGQPHEEDDWAAIRIGDLVIDLPKPCSRCVIPSIDQRTAEQDSSILKALAAYRRGEDGKIYFGQNGLHRSNGWIEVGQAVEPVKKPVPD